MSVRSPELSWRLRLLRGRKQSVSGWTCGRGAGAWQHEYSPGGKLDTRRGEKLKGARRGKTTAATRGVRGRKRDTAG